MVPQTLTTSKCHRQLRRGSVPPIVCRSDSVVSSCTAGAPSFPPDLQRSPHLSERKSVQHSLSLCRTCTSLAHEISQAREVHVLTLLLFAVMRSPRPIFSLPAPDQKEVRDLNLVQ